MVCGARHSEFGQSGSDQTVRSPASAANADLFGANHDQPAVQLSWVPRCAKSGAHFRMDGKGLPLGAIY